MYVYCWHFSNCFPVKSLCINFPCIALCILNCSFSLDFFKLHISLEEWHDMKKQALQEECVKVCLLRTLEILRDCSYCSLLAIIRNWILGILFQRNIRNFKSFRPKNIHIVSLFLKANSRYCGIGYVNRKSNASAVVCGTPLLEVIVVNYFEIFLQLIILK